MLKYDGKKFTFTADDDDVVTVDVNNSNASSTMIVVIGGVKNEVKEGTAVTLTQKVNAGEVAIEVTGTGYVTKIAVESQAYRDANAAVKHAQDVLNAKNAETAKYASDFSEFFTSVRGELNKQGVKIEKLIADLKGYKNEDQVSAKLDGFKSDLSTIEAAIAQIVTDADAAMASYKAIVDGQNAKDAQTAINNAKKTELAADALIVSADKKSVTNNGTSDYIYNFKPELKNNKVVKKLVKSSAKRDWVDSEMAKVQAELDNTKAAALKSLNAFPKHFMAENNEAAADFNAKFDADKAYVANLVARANVEVAHADHISTLAGDVKTLDAALASGFDKTSLGGYDAWKVTVDELSKAIAKTDNRYKVTAAELKTTISDKCDAAVTNQTKYRKDIIGQSYNKLTTKLAGVQTKLYDYSYKVSAKYQNEPETQKKYELEFAKIQNELNSIKAGYLDKNVEDAKLPTAWTNMVEQYSARVSALDTQEGNIETLWKATQSAQKDKVTELNKQKANELYATIDAARAYYDAQVLKINGYKTFEPTKSIADKIDVRLKNLFDIVLKLEQTKKAITDELTKCNENVAKAPDVEFDQTKDEYRFDKTKWLTEDKNTDVIGGIKAEIVAEVKVAIDEANKATYAYLYDAYNDGTEAFATVTGMQYLINVAKDKVQTGADNKEMSAAAASFKTAYDEIADKFEVINKVKTQVGKIEVAKAKIGELAPGGVPTVDAEVPAEGKVAKNLVDQIAAINAQTLDLVPAAIKGVDTELTSYKEQYKAIGKLKVDWSVAKADIANLYLKAKEADASLDETTFEKRLDAVNTAVTEISADLEKKATSATTVAEATAEKLAKQAEELKIINNYPLYVANNKAYDEANKLHKEVSDALAAAKTAVEALKDNVKAEFMPQLTAFDGKLAAESTALNTKKEDWTAQASNLAAVKANLEAYKTQIANVLKAAQEANKVDESLDYNKDGEINDLDQRAAQDATIAGSIRLDTYFDWVNKFVDYQMNNK